MIRRLFRDLSISSKLALIVMLPTAIALLLAALLFFIYDYRSHYVTTTQQLISTADMIGVNCTAALTFEDRDAAAEILSALSIHPGIVSAAVFTPDGEVFAEFRREGWPLAFPIAPPASRQPLCRPLYFRL